MSWCAVQSAEDAVADLIRELFAGRALDDQSKDDVASVRVRPPRARSKERPMPESNGQQGREPPAMRGMRNGLLDELLVLGIVEHATGVLEQHSERDGLAVGDLSGS